MRDLTESDFHYAAQRIGCQVAAIKAVCEVEAPGGGFNPDGSPKTLFEGHKFYKYTKGRYAKSDPDLCYPKWTRKFYGKTWQAEQARLKRAMDLDVRAAALSTSWGRFQIMGFNFASAGFTDLDDFLRAMHESEASQLLAFVEFIVETGLGDELRDLRWADFARLYNGPQYRENHYDTKMAAAYAKYKKQSA